MLKNIVLTFAFIVGLFFSEQAFAGKSYSSGSRKSYSSSTKVTPSVKITPSTKVTPSIKITPSTSSGKSYSSGNKSYSSPSTSTHQPTGPPKNSYSSRPQNTFQSIIAEEQKKVESRIQYKKAVTPRETYVTPKGKNITINPSDSKVTQVRNLPEDKWINRESRIQNFYTNYQNSSVPVVHYNDPYSTFFWLWMLDRSLDERARWAYNHRSEMDEARYRDLLTKDKALEAKIKELETEKKEKDPSYVPSGLPDADLQYTNDYVDAVYNPEPKPLISFEEFCSIVWGLMYLSVIVAIIIGVIYGVFIYRW